MTRKPQRWRVVCRRLQQMSPKLHRGILGLNPAADLHTIGPTQTGPARLPDEAGHRLSQPAANVANGVRRRSSTILVNRVCVEASIEFDFLIGGNRKRALVSRNAVPEILDKLDTLVHGQLLQLRFHRQSLVCRHSDRIRRSGPKAMALFWWVPGIWDLQHIG